MSDSLRVEATNGSAEVMHGDRCVALTVHDETGVFAGGLVLLPLAARQLADLLVEQARYSEEATA